VPSLPAGLSTGTLVTILVTFAGGTGGTLILGLLRHRPELQAIDKKADADVTVGQATFLAQVTASAKDSAERAEAAEKRLSEQYRVNAHEQEQMGREHDRLTSAVATLSNDNRIIKAQLLRADERIADLERQLSEERNTVELLNQILSRVDEGAATGLRLEVEQGAVRHVLGADRESDREARAEVEADRVAGRESDQEGRDQVAGDLAADRARSERSGDDGP
jgi:chromosome segregation ATPase